MDQIQHVDSRFSWRITISQIGHRTFSNFDKMVNLSILDGYRLFLCGITDNWSAVLLENRLIVSLIEKTQACPVLLLKRGLHSRIASQIIDRLRMANTLINHCSGSAKMFRHMSLNVQLFLTLHEINTWSNIPISQSMHIIICKSAGTKSVRGAVSVLFWWTNNFYCNFSVKLTWKVHLSAGMGNSHLWKFITSKIL